MSGMVCSLRPLTRERRRPQLERCRVPVYTSSESSAHCSLENSHSFSTPELQPYYSIICLLCSTTRESMESLALHPGLFSGVSEM